MQSSIYAAFELPVILMMAVIFAANVLRRNGATHNRLFSAIILTEIAALTCDVLISEVSGDLSKIVALRSLWAIDYILSSLLIVLFHYFMLAMTREKTSVPHLLDWIVIPLLALFSAVYLTSFLNGLFFDITAQGEIVRGDLFWVSTIIRLSVLILDIVVTVVFAKHNGLLRTVLLLLYEIIPIVVHITDGQFRLTFVYIAAAVLILVDYTVLSVEQDILLARQKQSLAEQEKRLTVERTKIMISQIQPHFLYNVISSIMSFCREEPDKAVDALADFSDYMRTNMRSLSLESPVPFEKELEHVETYIRLERYRFGDRLNIEYDIQARDFFIPALTLQPLVENAVKHGIGQRECGGNILLRTKKTEDGIVIKVEDDGVGFDISQLGDNENGDHIGIQNVRSRLDAMCGGTLIAESTPGVGTEMTVIIPYGKQEE